MKPLLRTMTPLLRTTTIAALLVTLGCQTTPATQVTARVVPEDQALADIILRLRYQAMGPLRTYVPERYPFNIALVPNGPVRDFRLELSAELRGGGLIQAAATGMYVEGEHREVVIKLTHRCVDVMCGAGQSCREGSCETDRTSTAPFREEVEMIVPRDAGTDTDDAGEDTADANTDPDTCRATSELCNEEDDDCDGRVDELVRIVHWLDEDGDGFGREGTADTACVIPIGRADNNEDCQDDDPLVNPESLERCNARDDDCDTMIDEDPDTCVCARGERSGSIYQFCSNVETWENASTYCRRRGYELVEINDADENEFVMRQAGDLRTWIGLNDREERDVYQWANGGSSEYRKWSDMQPNGAEERCVELIPFMMGEWNDNECVQPNPFICEAP